jgi:hypothetical protein
MSGQATSLTRSGGADETVVAQSDNLDQCGVNGNWEDGVGIVHFDSVRQDGPQREVIIQI